MPKTPTKTQKTPKGYEIPVPTRREFYAAVEALGPQRWRIVKKPWAV